MAADIRIRFGLPRKIHICTKSVIDGHQISLKSVRGKLATAFDSFPQISQANDPASVLSLNYGSKLTDHHPLNYLVKKITNLNLPVFWPAARLGLRFFQAQIL